MNSAPELTSESAKNYLYVCITHACTYMCVFCVGVVSLCFMVKQTTYWCHEDGLYTSLNPLRNNPLVEGVNTEAQQQPSHMWGEV